MGTSFWWIYDIICVIVIIFSVYSCAKKGFSKILIGIIGCVVSILIASFISNNCSNFIYEKFIKESSIEAVEKAMEKYDPSVSVRQAIEDEGYGEALEDSRIKSILESDDSIERLYEYVNQAAGDVVDTHENFKENIMKGFTELFANHLGVNLPPYVTQEITEKVSESEQLFSETTEMILRDPDSVPEYIEKNYIRSPALKLIKAFAFLITFLILMAIISVVINRSFKFGLLNGYDRLDKTVGGILGMVKATVILLIIAVLVKIMINVAGSNESFISYDAVEKTKIFKYIFNTMNK